MNNLRMKVVEAMTLKELEEGGEMRLIRDRVWGEKDFVYIL